MTYELSLEKFTGPLPKLLELIEARQLDIAEISLAAVTDDFLKYLETLKARVEADQARAQAGEKREAKLEEYMRLVADFVVVASRLIVIKSKSLLPNLPLTEEEQSEIHELEERLRAYRALKPAIRAVQTMARRALTEGSRPYFLELGQGGVFYPGSVDLHALAEVLGKIFEGLFKSTHEEGTIREALISLEEKMREIIVRIRELGEADFKTLLISQSRSEIIVVFLAILHLVRERAVEVLQDRDGSDIIIRKRAG